MPTKLCLALFLILSTTGCLITGPGTIVNEKQAIAAVLDDFHDAAAKADGERYFGHLAQEAVFLGTDPEERWTRQAFLEFALPYFQGESAWTFTPRDRFIFVAEGHAAAWFDETVDSAHYGACRGSGVLVQRKGEWLITQYNLSLPIPNDLMKDVVKLILSQFE